MYVKIEDSQYPEDSVSVSGVGQMVTLYSEEHYSEYTKTVLIELDLPAAKRLRRALKAAIREASTA